MTDKKIWNNAIILQMSVWLLLKTTSKCLHFVDALIVEAVFDNTNNSFDPRKSALLWIPFFFIFIVANREN